MVFDQLPKNKNILCIFAHPDDDAFGPSGTIIKLTKENNLYEVFITNGQSGTNQQTGKKEKKLGKLRKKEAIEGAKIMGVRKVYFLDYLDAHLCNKLYHEVASKIQKIIDNLKINLIITYEPRGVSGHIDHVFVSMVSSFLAKKNKIKIWYYCLSKEQTKNIKNYFIYFPPGYKKNEIDLSVNINDVIDEKIKAIKCHKTQIKDGNDIIKNILKNKDLNEYFLIKKV